MDIKILFVCLGNICRSPLAEAIFKEKVKKAGLDEIITVDSCGTGNYHIGEDPDPRSIAIADKHAVPIHHKARQLSRKDGDQFNYIIVMDDKNHEDTMAVVHNGSARVLKMRHFDPIGRDEDVPDPYFGGDEGFQHVYDMLDRSSIQFLEYLKKEYQIK